MMKYQIELVYKTGDVLYAAKGGYHRDPSRAVTYKSVGQAARALNQRLQSLTQSDRENAELKIVCLF